jgi:hypothetical protein
MDRLSIRAGVRVADIGAGTGHYTAALPRRACPRLPTPRARDPFAPRRPGSSGQTLLFSRYRSVLLSRSAGTTSPPASPARLILPARSLSLPAGRARSTRQGLLERLSAIRSTRQGLLERLSAVVGAQRADGQKGRPWTPT